MAKYFMTGREFIQGPLMKEIESIAEHHPYHAFVLEAVAIEFLGKALDKNLPWDSSGKSELHFTNAILNLFPTKYHPFALLLYRELRCGMTHFYGPKPRLELIREAEVKEKGKHLSIDKTGKLVLVIQDLHKDFKKAAMKLLKLSKDDPKNKVNKPVLNI